MIALNLSIHIAGLLGLALGSIDMESIDLEYKIWVEPEENWRMIEEGMNAGL